MKSIHIILSAVCVLAASAHVQAATDHAHHAPAESAAATPASEGEVRKVDREQGKITLRHGPIANLDMSGMTMVFRVSSPGLLDAVKPGDKVRFTAESINGALTVTALEVAR